MNNTIDIILSNSSVSSTNKGCSALAYSALQLINDICSENNIKYNIFLTGIVKNQNRGHIRTLGKDIEFANISNPIAKSLKDKIINTIYYKRFRKSQRAFSSANLLLDVGEGDSFADIYGSYRYKYITQWNKSAKRFKVPVVRLPQTIGPFKDSTILKDATALMEYSPLTMARDKQSFDFVKSLSPRIKTDEYIDLAFLLPYQKYKFDPSKNHIGINISALLWNGGYTRDNQFNLKSDYQQLIHSIIDNLLIIDNKAQIHLISHVFDITSDNIENDYRVATDIYKKLNSERITLAPPTFDPIDVKSYIAGMNFFMGARMHSDIAAFSAKVPVVPMAYSRKFNGLFMDTLKYPHVADLTAQSQDEIIELILNSYNNRDTLKQELETAHANVVNPRISKLKSDLTEVIKQFAQ